MNTGFEAAHPPRRRSTSWLTVAVSSALVMTLAACGGSAASRASTVAPSASFGEPPATVRSSGPSAVASLAPSSASDSASPSAPASASAAAAFESTVYPYALALPPGVLTRNWRAATVPWDGQGRVATDTPNVDTTGTTHGGLLVWGLPWDGDVAGFSRLIRDTMARFHGCSVDAKPQPFEVGGVAGLAQRQSCALETETHNAALVKDGYGLVFRVQVSPSKESVIFDEVVSWLEGLRWTAR